MKRFELLIALLLIPVDFLALVLAAISAYQLRFVSSIVQVRPVIFLLDFESFIWRALPIIVLWLVIFALTGLYNIRHPRRILHEIGKVFVASILGFAAITVFIFLRGELFSSRFIILAAVGFAFLYASFGRLLMRSIKFAFYRRGIGSRRVLLFGNDKTVKALIQFIKDRPSQGLRVIAQVKEISENALAELKANMSSLQPDLVLLGQVGVTKEQTETLLDFAKEYHLEFHYAADLFDTKAANTDLSTIGDVPIVEIKQTPLEGWGRIYKRTFDLVAGIIFSIIALPFIILIALAIKLDSRGPILYKNTRVGKNGEPFSVYKFRRMKIEFCTGPGYDVTGEAAKIEQDLIKKQSHREGPLYKISQDPRNTRVGRFLEKTSLDELPQLFNVLVGNMSLVGPRPHQPREVEKYQKHEKQVLGIKPGVTGLAQISGRSDLDFDEEVRLDTFYIENWSSRMDLAILLKTPLAVFKKRRYS